MWGWLLHVLGVEPRSPSTAYNWWSGAGSDLGEMAILGAVAGAFRHHNCHVRRCWRLGRHPHGPYRLCARHMPGIPQVITAAHIQQVGKQ